MDHDVNGIKEMVSRARNHIFTLVFTPLGISDCKRQFEQDSLRQRRWQCRDPRSFWGQVATSGVSSLCCLDGVWIQTVSSPPALGSLCTLPLHLVHGVGRRVFLPQPFAFRLPLPLSCDAASAVKEESRVLRHSELVEELAAGDGLSGVWH